MYLKVFAPASVGNVSLGFDILGAALQPIDGTLFGDEVELQTSDVFSLECAGAFKHVLPEDSAQNIVTYCYHHFTESLIQRSIAFSPVAMTLHKHLPVGSGLGSSAASIVAALHGLNVFYGEPFNQMELLEMMGKLEGQISGSIHYDNVAPAFLGGLVLTTEVNGQIATNLPVINDWYWVACYSGVNVSTSAARQILPTEVPMKTAIQFGKQLAIFVDALHRQDAPMALSVIHDVIAEPYRKELLPYFDESRAFAMQNGAGAFGISGSGPTVFGLCDDLSQAQKINDWLKQHYVQKDTGFSHICQLDLQGSRVVKE